MPHQREIVDAFLEVQSEAAGDPEPGEWAYDDGLATLERRAGKTAIQAPLVTHRARLVRGAQMFMTAQKRDKAVRRWHDITEDLLRTSLRSTVRRKVSHSFEELRWLDGGACLIPFAPTEDEMHSETPDLVLIDELWAFSAVQRQQVEAGYVPAFATSSGQALKLSTAGTDKSAWLNDNRAAGRRAVEAGVRLGKFYYEHSLPDRVGGVRIRDLSDEQLVEACIANHPAICHVPGCPGPRQKRPCPHGFTVRPAALRSAWGTMNDRGEYLRGYGNRSAADLSALWQAIEESLWLDRIDEGQIPVSARVALGVWVSEDGQHAAVSSGWRDDLRVMHVEIPQIGGSPTVFDTIRAVRPMVERIAEGNDVSTVALPNVGAARDLADELEAAGVPVTRVSQADLPAACSRHRTELGAGTWRHRVSTEATAAAQAAGWHRGKWDEPGEPIAALGAQTMAGWGFDHAPAAKTRRPFKVR